MPRRSDRCDERRAAQAELIDQDVSVLGMTPKMFQALCTAHDIGTDVSDVQLWQDLKWHIRQYTQDKQRMRDGLTRLVTGVIGRQTGQDDRITLQAGKQLGELHRVTDEDPKSDFDLVRQAYSKELQGWKDE